MAVAVRRFGSLTLGGAGVVSATDEVVDVQPHQLKITNLAIRPLHPSPQVLAIIASDSAA